MEILVLGKDRITEIRSLWEGLNSLHAKLSPNFKIQYQNFTFGKRIEKLLKKDMLKVFVASESGKYIGYCIASIEEDAGEIESIFINPEFRNRKTGHLLMDAALKW